MNILTSCIDFSELGVRPLFNQTKAKTKKFRLVEVKASESMGHPRYFFIQKLIKSKWVDGEDVGYTDEEEAFIAFGEIISLEVSSRMPKLIAEMEEG